MLVLLQDGICLPAIKQWLPQFCLSELCVTYLHMDKLSLVNEGFGQMLVLCRCTLITVGSGNTQGVEMF